MSSLVILGRGPEETTESDIMHRPGMAETHHHVALLLQIAKEQFINLMNKVFIQNYLDYFDFVLQTL